MNPTPNGRVNIIQPDTSMLFKMYDRIPARQMATYQAPTAGLFASNEVMDRFFSASNIDVIQKGLRDGVYHMSRGNFVISNQDEDTLIIIMRAIYLQYSINMLDDINGQIKDLNNRVLAYSVKQVYNEARGYMKYITDASTMYTPIDRPVLSYSEDKNLELKPWF